MQTDASNPHARKHSLRHRIQISHKGLDGVDFWVEPLEDRRLLAGQVRVLVNGNDVRVMGDAADNDVQVGIVGGDVNIFSSSGSTNVVNGDTGIAEGNLDSLRVILRGGDDTFEILPGIDVQRNLDIRTAGGSDFIRLHGDNRVIFDTNVRTGGGQDFFYAEDSVFEGNFRMVAGAGNDFVFLGGDQDEMEFEGTFNVSMGGGSDAFTLRDSTAFRFVAATNRVNGGGGFDNLYPLTNQFIAEHPNFIVRGFEF